MMMMGIVRLASAKKCFDIANVDGSLPQSLSRSFGLCPFILQLSMERILWQ